MAEGQLFKPDKDFSKEADKVIPEAQELAKVYDCVQYVERTLLRLAQNNVQAALEKLAGLEKSARQVYCISEVYLVRPLWLMLCHRPGFRSCLYLKVLGRYYHNMQRCWRLAAIE